jgi:hypothetical protein
MVALLFYAATSYGQSSATAPPSEPAHRVARPAAAPVAHIEIYRIELNPTGSTFALGEPRPVADGWVYRGLVEKAQVHIPKSMVKAITPMTKDLNAESAWELVLLPKGTVVAREEPKLKSNAYVFHTFKTGTLISVKKSDVKSITYLTGLPAFKAKQQALGASVLVGNLSMEGGTLRVVPTGNGPAPGPAPAPGPEEGTGWYVVGASEAFPPGNAVVAHPGDVPKMPEPPPPPPR